MRASDDMAMNYLIAIGIIALVGCFVCAGLASDTLGGILAIILAPFRFILHLFGLAMINAI